MHVRIPTSVRSTWGVVAAGVILSGCGNGAESQLAPAIVAQPNAATLVSRSALETVRPDHQASWLRSDATKGMRLYISDASTNDVFVYAYPSGKLVGTLTGFSEPQGICVDGAGNFWVANTGASNLLEFAPGGTDPIATLNDAGQYPAGCAVDAGSGDLAASNIISTSGGQGSVSRYKRAVGNPRVISAFPRVYFDAYDTGGNLFLDGSNADGTFALGEIMKGKKSVKPLTVKGATINFPGDIQYADGRLAVGDQSGPNNAVIYQMKVHAGTAVVVGNTQLFGSSDVVQFFILGHVVISLDAGTRKLNVYRYPAGGKPITIIHLSGPLNSQPVGLAVGPS